MNIKTITQSPFIVDTEAERSTAWPDNSFVFCKDTKKIYQLVSGTFFLVPPKLASGAHIDDAPTDAVTTSPTNSSTTLSGLLITALTGELNTTNAKQNTIAANVNTNAVKLNDTATKLNTLFDRLEAIEILLNV